MDTITETGLTREHLKVLRNTDTILVRHHGEEFKHADGTEVLPATFFECIKRVDPRDGFGEREMRVSVPVRPARFRIFTQDSATEGYVANDRRPVSHAIWSLHPKYSDNPANTLVHHTFKAGDRVTPIWVCNNNNDNVRNAGLTVDEFHIEIIRGPVEDQSKCKRLTVLLDTMVLPPLSLAREVTWA